MLFRSYTTGTTVGTDVANVGYVVMSQSAEIAQTTNISVAGVYKTTIVVPAGSRIISIVATVTTAWTTGGTINVGTNSTATQLAVAADNDFSTTVGNKTIIPGDDATRSGKWIDVGATDVQIYVLSTNTGTGVGVLTVNYAQALDLTA